MFRCYVTCLNQNICSSEEEENQLLQFVNIWLYKHYHKHLSSETLWYVNLNMHLKNHAASTDQQMIIITFSFFIGSSLHSDNIKSIASAHPMQKSGTKSFLKS